MPQERGNTKGCINAFVMSSSQPRNLGVLPSDQVFLNFAVAGHRYLEQNVAPALFALLHQHIQFCKETACLLQKQIAEWDLENWDLVAIKASLESAGLVCNPDCLSSVGIPL